MTVLNVDNVNAKLELKKRKDGVLVLHIQYILHQGLIVDHF